MACYGSNTLMSSFGIGLLIRFIYGCGVGITTPPVTESIMGSLPRSRAGVGSAVNDTTRQTGGAVGVAVIGSLFAARYHAQIGSLSFLPAGVRQAARESIGTSLTEAAKQPAGAAQHLIDVAHAAFLSSMRLTYTVLVLVIATAIVVAFKWLPARAPAVDDVPAAPHAEAPAGPLGEAPAAGTVVVGAARRGRWCGQPIESRGRSLVCGRSLMWRHVRVRRPAA